MTDPHSDQGMSTHDISSSAQAAREQHRDPTGKFGTQPAGESQASLEPSDHDRLQALMAAQGARMNAAQAAYEEADKQMVEASVIGAAAAVRDAYPEATTLIIENDDGESAYWGAQDADGNDIDVYHEDGMHDAMHDWASGLDVRRPWHLEKFAKGYREGDPMLRHYDQGTFSTERSGALHKVTIDIDEVLAKADGPAAQTRDATAADLNNRVDAALAQLDPDEENWPTGEQVEAIVEATRAHERGAPMPAISRRADELSVGDKFTYEGELHRVASTDGDHKSLTVETDDGEFLELKNDEQVGVDDGEA